MALRPVPATWFEVLTPRDNLTVTLECLAASGAVELQIRGEVTTRLATEDIRRSLEEFAELTGRFAAYWPVAAVSIRTAREPLVMLERSMTRLREWVARAESLIERVQTVAREQADLELLKSMIEGSSERLPDFQRLANAGPVLGCSLHLLPPGAWPEVIPPSVAAQPSYVDGRSFLLAVGPAPEINRLSEQLTGLRARPIELPAWLPSGRSTALRTVDQRLTTLSESASRLQDELSKLNAELGVGEALGELRLLEWFASRIPDLPTTERFGWVTGWTIDSSGRELERALEHDGVRYLLHLPAAPPDLEPPMIFRNPWWARPFQLFTELLGMPGAQEADPSRIVAILVPLMFGYMFGDVGQGFVLMVLGLALRARLPALSILVPGGFSSMIFGLFYGSIFSREDLIPALWLHPLEQPITVLGVALGFGVTVILLGLALAAAQSFWAGQHRRWWLTDAAVVTSYLGVLAAFVDSRALWVATTGVVWFVVGSSWLGGGRSVLGAVARAIGEFLETFFQLLVNTVSFVRVGAFALAHAGLSAAIVGVSETTSVVVLSALVMLLGNVLIIGLEGLVVSIQTTRLILFEFFIRFLRAGGRQFRPLLAPVKLIDQNRRSPS